MIYVVQPLVEEGWRRRVSLQVKRASFIYSSTRSGSPHDPTFMAAATKNSLGKSRYSLGRDETGYTCVKQQTGEALSCDSMFDITHIPTISQSNTMSRQVSSSVRRGILTRCIGSVQYRLTNTSILLARVQVLLCSMDIFAFAQSFL